MSARSSGVGAIGSTFGTPISGIAPILPCLIVQHLPFFRGDGATEPIHQGPFDLRLLHVTLGRSANAAGPHLREVVTEHPGITGPPPRSGEDWGQFLDGSTYARIDADRLFRSTWMRDRPQGRVIAWVEA
ncbi:MAG: hypothetical protein NVSMB4_06720 [Acidimicrobiales bacterium]